MRKEMSETIRSYAVILLCVLMIGCSVNEVFDDINVALQIATSIGEAVGSVSAADEAVIQSLSTTATAGLNVVQAAYNQYEQSGATTDLQKVQAAIAAAQSQLQAAMAAAHIEDPVSQQKVKNWFNVIIGSLNAILAALPAFQAAQANARAFTIPVTAQGLQSRWEKEVCDGNAKCAKLVRTPRHGWNRAAHFGKQ